MSSFFEPESYLLDPTSSHDESPSSFLSFSSFADLNFASPFASTSWDLGVGSSKKPLSQPHSSRSQNASDTSSPSPQDPFEIIESAFESATPGIFHTPEKGQPARLSSESVATAAISHRSSSSSDSWNTPITPLSNRSSIDSAPRTTSGDLHLPPSRSSFAWDEAATSSLGSTSSYATTPYTPAAHRTTSNPVLGSSSTPRRPKAISSMPALREEDQSSSSAWYEGIDFPAMDIPSVQVDTNAGPAEDLLDDFDWVFGDYGLGNASTTTTTTSARAVPADGTIFAAFHAHDQSKNNASSSAPDAAGSTDYSWFSGPSTQDVDGSEFDFSDFADMPNFTIDPMAIMGPNGMEEDFSRPSSAPGMRNDEGYGMLSVPVADMMSKRSLSSDGLTTSRHAPPRELFSYTPQQISAGPPPPQPLYTTDPSPSYGSHYSRSMPIPLTPSHTRRVSTSGKTLSVQIHPPIFSTYAPSPLPPTPQSATFGDVFSVSQATYQVIGQAHAQVQPIPMARAGTQPLPMTRKVSGGIESTSLPNDAPRMPAHLVRAQAIVQMQEAKDEAQRAEMRRQVSARKVGINEASVMQPQARHQHIMGWEGPSAQTASLPMLTRAPLVTVHPPPATYVLYTAMPPTPHRVHPPPHPGGGASRPIARLPSSPSKRKPSNSSSKRSPSGKKRTQAGAGGFSWGEATFINFTSDDADKLLTGVAPSGSQAKRKREDGGFLDVDSVFGEEDLDRTKRSRSGEC